MKARGQENPSELNPEKHRDRFKSSQIPRRWGQDTFFSPLLLTPQNNLVFNTDYHTWLKQAENIVYDVVDKLFISLS